MIFFAISFVVLTLLLIIIFEASFLGVILLRALAVIAVLSVLFFITLCQGILSIFSLIKPIRYGVLTKPCYRFLRAQLPPMSQTEKEAIAAGDVWWDAALFSGKPDWQQWQAWSFKDLSADEKSFLNHDTHGLCDLLNDWEVLHERYDLPSAAWDYLKTHRFFAMAIPREYGGLGFSASAQAAVITKIATRCPSAAVTAMVPNSLGPGELLVRYGTSAQKQQYLPRLAAGQEIPCFALTGPMAGSDAANMMDYGVVCYGEHNGERVLGLKVTWDKRYITLAPVATLLGLAFQVYDPDHLLGEQEQLGITLAIIPTQHPGVEIGQRHYPGMAFMNGPTHGNGVFMPFEFIIGGQAMIGQGWRMLMECLSTGRSISLPALSNATAQFCVRTTGAYSRVRQQFNVSIAQFDGVKTLLARMTGLTYLLSATCQVTAQAVDQGLSPAIVSAIAKYHTTEMAREVMQHAMDIHAGKAIQMGPKNYCAGAYVAIPVSITVEGANVLTRNLIIFGQGLMRCHPTVLKLMTALQNPDKAAGLKAFDRHLQQQVLGLMRNIFRTVWFGITGARTVRTPYRGNIARIAKQITRFSSALAFVSDVAMLTLGGALKRKENLSARLGDVLSYLYMASCVLKVSAKKASDKETLLLARWACNHALHQAQEALIDFCDNFPSKILGKCMKCLVFPFGRQWSKNSDALNAQLADLITQPSAARRELTQLCFQSQTDTDAVALLEKAFLEVVRQDPLLKKFKQLVKQNRVSKAQPLASQVSEAMALGLLTQAEGKALQQVQRLVADVVAVDAFDQHYFTNLSRVTHA